MDEAGLRQMTIPAYIIVGAGDTTTPPKENAEFAAKYILVDLRPRAASEGLLGKQVHGMAQMPVTGPSLVAGPARRIGFGFASAPGHRRGTPQALQSLGSGAEAIPVIADFRLKPWGELRSGPWQGTEQVMVWMPPEKFLDALTVDP